MNEIFTHFLKLPVQTKGLVIPTPEGDYTVIINTMFASETNKETYQHELRHIILGHHQDLDRPVTEIEKEANHPTLLLEEIVTASMQGISTPLFPKNIAKETASSQKKQYPSTVKMENLTPKNKKNIAIKETKDSFKKLTPYLLPPDSDPLDILEAVLESLQTSKQELDVILQEKKSLPN